MAGDWIKMRGNLWDDPRVASICDATDQGEAAIIGGLYWLWAAADQHTEDGLMPGLSLRQIDRKTGIAGFGLALVGVDWLEETPDGVRILKFEEHNGSSAKRRCSEAQRKANGRNVSASDADKARTDSGHAAPDERTESGRRAELEKEKEEEKSTSSLRSEVGRASRLPTDWTLPDDWADWARSERPDLDPVSTSCAFRDYWVAKAGKDGRKADWLATWRNWVRNQRSPTAPRGTGPPQSRQSALEARNAAVAARFLETLHVTE